MPLPASVQVTVGVGPGDTVDLYNHIGSVDLIADVSGYFGPPAVPCTGGCVSGWCDDFHGALGVRGDGVGVITSPAPLYGLSNITSVSYSYASRADGTVWAWGMHAGSLATGSNAGASFVAKQVNGLSGITAIATNSTSFNTSAPGQDFGFALRSDGTVLSWGYNGEGELGQGSHDTNPQDWSSVPSPIPGLTGGDVGGCGFGRWVCGAFGRHRMGLGAEQQGSAGRWHDD